MELIDGYTYLVMLVCIVGAIVCAYVVGRLDGIQHEKKRAARVRRMVGGYVPRNERNG